MKKFLIASTAIVALSGAAAAEVTVSGDAQFGLQYDNRMNDGSFDADGVWSNSGTTGDVSVRSRVRITVTGTGETDSGLSFGIKVRTGSSKYTESRDNFSSNTTVWAEGAYGKLTVGDVDSAIEQAIGDLPEVGFAGLGFRNELFYAATDAFEEHDNKGVVYSYKYGDASFYVSFEDKRIGYDNGKYKGDSWSVGASYDVQQYSFGIGYSSGADFGVWSDHDSDPDTPDVRVGNTGKAKSWGVMAAGDFNGLTGKLAYVETKDDFDKLRQIGVGAEYTLPSGIGLQGFYLVNDIDNYGDYNTLALGASYDLGGGAIVKGGVAYTKDKPDVGPSSSRTIADLGLQFKF